MKNLIKKILKEETSKNPYPIIRRTHLIDREVKRVINSVYTPNVICKNYTGGHELTTVISHTVIENLYFNTFYKMNDELKDWEDVAQYIYDYVHEKYGEFITNHYQSSC